MFSSYGSGQPLVLYIRIYPYLRRELAALSPL
jgi:hypothetical protein